MLTYAGKLGMTKMKMYGYLKYIYIYQSQSSLIFHAILPFLLISIYFPWLENMLITFQDVLEPSK